MLLFLFFIIFSYADASIISNIEVKGNKEIPKIVILDLVDFVKGDEFSLDKVSSSYKKLIESNYLDRVSIFPTITDGQLYITIEVKEIEDIYNLLKKKGIYTLSEISKNKVPPIIGKIILDGNYSVSDEEVLNKIELNIGSYYSLDKLEMAKNSLERMGLFSKVWYTSFKSEEYIEVTFGFEENQFIGDRISFAGNSLIDSETLLEVVKTEKNSIMNLRILQQDMVNIEKLYSDEDYMGITVRPSFEGDNLVFNIDEPILNDVIFERKNYLGNDEKLNTHDYVLRRHVVLKADKIIKKSDINRSIMELKRLGFIKTISPNIVDAGNGKKNVVFIIEEEMGLKVSASAQGSFDGELKFVGMFEDKNFLGREFDLALSVDYDTKKRWKGKVSFFDPWVYGTNGLSFGVEVYRTNEDTKRDNMYFNRSLSTGGSVTSGIPLFFNDLRISLKEDFKLVEQLDTLDNLWDYYLQNTVTLSLTLNLLNNYIDPTKGLFSKLSIGLESHFEYPGVEYINFENKPNIVVTNFSNRVYTPFISDMNTIACRAELGYSKFLTSTNEQFGGYNIGGHNTIRGYDDEEMKGNFYLLMNLEDRIAVYDKEIKLEIFTFLT